MKTSHSNHLNIFLKVRSLEVISSFISKVIILKAYRNIFRLPSLGIFLKHNSKCVLMMQKYINELEDSREDSVTHLEF